MINYNLALETDLDFIREVLKANHLPYSDLGKSPITFLVARHNQTIIGCIGVEKYGNDGLLRSFAVFPAFRNKGIGKELYKNLLEFAVQNNISALHLLTDTASGYFLKLGYHLADRNNAPAGIAGSIEFSVLCPVSSSYMVLDAIS